MRPEIPLARRQLEPFLNSNLPLKTDTDPLFLAIYLEKWDTPIKKRYWQATRDAFTSLLLQITAKPYAPKPPRSTGYHPKRAPFLP